MWPIILDSLKWAALHVIVPILLFITWSMISRKPNFVTDSFNYLRPTWEGEDGKLSYRRSSQFVFILLIVFVVVRDKTQTPYGFWTMVVLGVIFLLLAAIITGQQIIEGIKGIGAIRSGIAEFGAEVEQKETKTETTTETDSKITIPSKEEADAKKEGFE